MENIKIKTINRLKLLLAQDEELSLAPKLQNGKKLQKTEKKNKMKSH